MSIKSQSISNKKLSKSMDLFARAVIELYQKGFVDFEFEFETEDGKIFRETHDLSRYLRKNINEFSDLEQKLFVLCYGRVLDIGSGTGNYLPFIKGEGGVLGLEISSQLVKFGKGIFSKNLVCGDFFEYDFKKQKFDTITLLENNLGMCGSFEKLDKMIEIIKDLLTSNGQILLITYKVNLDSKLKITPYLNSKKGESFDWISFSEKSVKEIFSKKGFSVKIIDQKPDSSLLQIKKL